MQDFVAVAKTADIPPGERKRVQVGEERITIFNIDERFYAIRDTCPHKKTAPLLRGTLDGTGIKCPNHGYRFDLNTGACNVSPEFNTRVFPVEIRGNDVCVKI